MAFTRAKEKLIITGCIKDEEMLQQIREIYCGSNRKALNFKERAEAKDFLGVDPSGGSRQWQLGQGFLCDTMEHVRGRGGASDNRACVIEAACAAGGGSFGYFV